jgi:hypothetical protein
MRERRSPPRGALQVVSVYWGGRRHGDPYRTPWWLHVVTVLVGLGAVVGLAELGWSKTPAVLGTAVVTLLAQALCGWLLVLFHGVEPADEGGDRSPGERRRRRLRRRARRAAPVEGGEDRPLLPPDLRARYEAEERAAAPVGTQDRLRGADAGGSDDDPPGDDPTHGDPSGDGR